MNSKNHDSNEHAERRNLLKQRLIEDRTADSNSLSQFSKDPTSSLGISEPKSTPNFPIELTSSIRRISNSTEDSNKKGIFDEKKIKDEIEKEIAQEFQPKFEKIKQITMECLRDYAFAHHEYQQVEISRKQEKLGTLITSMNGNSQWCGGIEVQRCEREVDRITHNLESLKKAEHQQKSEAISQRKNYMQSALKEYKAKLKSLEDERAEFARELRLSTDRNQSDFRIDQTLHEGRYLLLQLIGRGGFSEVWWAYDKQESRSVAIKIQNMDKQWSTQVKDNFKRHSDREIKILSSTQHKNVVSFYESFYIDDNTLALVMEYCGGGDLAEMIRRRGRIPEKEAKIILAQVIGGLLALRLKENYVIHYDLKPANILLSEDQIVKITDFGLSKIVEGDTSSIELTTQGTGTYYYAAPETFQRGKSVYITKSVDTWSLGIIFFEMLYGTRPFGEIVSHQENLVGAHIFSQAVKVSEQGKNFILKCLEKDPAMRPDLSTLATDDEYIHPILVELNL